jgi:hypothetical protein
LIAVREVRYIFSDKVKHHLRSWLSVRVNQAFGTGLERTVYKKQKNIVLELKPTRE